MIVSRAHSFLKSGLAVGSHNSDAGDRDVLIDEARNLFGNDAVIPVSNFNTLKLKSLVKDVAKFFNVPFEEVNAVTGPLQDEVMPHAKDDDQEKSVFVLKHEDCMKYSPAYKAMMEKYPDVERHVSTLFMENRSIGRHAGGVLVAPEAELAETMPIIAVRGELQTPWTEGMNFRNLEDNGFLKFDFLGLTLLKDVENCIRRILIKHHGIKDPTFAQVKAFFDKHLNCRNVKQDDAEVWKHVYHEGRFVGVFQFTATGARQFCLEAKPDSIDELAALTAIYRPGPLKANVHKLYVKAKQDASKVKYDHPVIKDVLGPTFGYVVFQEQFMMLAEKLAGFTPGEADQLRKTLVKKSLDTLGKKSAEKEAAMQKFVEGAKRIHGVSEKVTVPLWETIEAFSVYGFNKTVYSYEQVDVVLPGGRRQSVAIKDVKPGSLIATRDEKSGRDTMTRVNAVHDHGKIPMFKITLDTGEKVTCSMHHKFRVESGEMMPLWLILQEGLSIVTAESSSRHDDTSPTEFSVNRGLDEAWQEVTM